MGMKTAALIIGFVLTSAVVGFGQTRTVTNFDLEKYQQKRLNAEREYRENYKRLGLPSPEELDKQRDEDMKARLALADQLRQARLEKERLELERRGLEVETTRVDPAPEYDESGGYYYGGVYYGGVGTFGSRRGHGRFRGRNFNSGGYRVTPFQIIQTPRQPRPQRVIVRSGRRR
jgi:hypothetical protein